MADLEKLALARHPLPEWVALTEWRPSTGYTGLDRRLDVAAFATWPSRKYYRIAYEMKRSRGDFLRELDHPDKRAWTEEHFHETWFVVSDPKIAPLEELPVSWGLLVPTKKGDGLRQLRRAAPREPKDLSTAAWTSAIRRIAERAAALERGTIVDGASLSRDELEELVATRVHEAVQPMTELLFKERERAREAIGAAEGSMGPLRHLARVARDFVDWTESDERTVDRLIERAVTRRIESLTSLIRNAHEELGALRRATEGERG
jgi:hypothetical protein